MRVILECSVACAKLPAAVTEPGTGRIGIWICTHTQKKPVIHSTVSCMSCHIHRVHLQHNWYHQNRTKQNRAKSSQTRNENWDQKGLYRAKDNTIEHNKHRMTRNRRQTETADPQAAFDRISFYFYKSEILSRVTSCKRWVDLLIKS